MRAGKSVSRVNVMLLTLVIAALAGAVGCGGPAEPPSAQEAPEAATTPAAAEPVVNEGPGEAPEELQDTARQASLELMGTLKARLVQEMNAGGPASAVKVCSEVAQEIADRHSTDTMSLRRISLKVRNPLDRPTDLERERLEALHELHAEGALPEEQFFVVEHEDARELLYLRPITIQKPCLNCHGPLDQMSEDVKARLAELYPDDEATGYQEGDLRGAVVVRASLP